MNTVSATNRIGLVLRLLLPLAVLGAGIGAFSYFATPVEEAKAEATPPKPIRTRVEKLNRRDYTVTVKTNGIVQAHNQVSLSAEVAGRVLRVTPAFEAGAYFSEGDVLVELDDRDYKTALAVADANKLGAEAALELAAETYQRNQDLYARKGVSEAQLKASFASQEQAQAQLDTTLAQLERARRDLSRTRIVAPFDGRVRMKMVGEGQTVGTGTSLGEIFAVDYAEVRLPISSRERLFLDLPENPGEPPVNVQLFDAIDLESSAVWQAKILRTEGVLDADSLELFAIARIEDPFGRTTGDAPLRIGQPVVAAIDGRTLHDVVAIPRQAVRQLDQVFFIDTDTIRNAKLDPIWTDEEHLIVSDEEIQDGQMIAMTRIVHAPDGAKVEIIPEIELTSTSTNDSSATITKPVAK